jgi:hypothetical protein
MMFKVALVLALASLWVAVCYRRERQDEAGLTRDVETQLHALRSELFRR